MQSTRRASPGYKRVDDPETLKFKANMAVKILAVNIAGLYGRVASKPRAESPINEINQRKGRARKSGSTSKGVKKPEKQPFQVFGTANGRLMKDRSDNSVSLDRTISHRASPLNNTYTTLTEQLNHLKTTQESRPDYNVNVFKETMDFGSTSNHSKSNVERLEAKFGDYLIRNAERDKTQYNNEVSSQRYHNMYNELTTQQERLLSPDTPSYSPRDISPKVGEQKLPLKGSQRITENYYLERQVDPSFKTDYAKHYEQPSFRRNITDREFTVKVEKPVVHERVVEKPYDVYVQKPVKNIIEKEIINERFVDHPIQKVVDYEVETIIPRPIEKIVEKPVVVEKIQEYEVENIIEKPVDVIKEVEVPITKVVDKPIERLVIQPYRKEFKTKEVLVEDPVYEEIVIEKPVTKEYERYVDMPETEYVEKEIIKEVEVPVYRTIRQSNHSSRSTNQTVDINQKRSSRKSVVHRKVVEKPYEVVVEVEKPINKVVTKEVEVPIYVDKIVEKKVDQYVDKPEYITKEIEVPKTKEVEKIIEVERVEEIEEPQFIDKPVEVSRFVEIEVERRIPRYVETPQERYIEKPVIKEVIVPIEKPIEKKTTRSVSRPKIVEVEKFVDVPVNRYVDKEIVVDRVVDAPVYVDKVVEVPKHVVYEKVVEVPITKYVKVPKNVKRDESLGIKADDETPINSGQGSQDETDNNKNQRLIEKRDRNWETINQLEAELAALTNKLKTTNQDRSANSSIDIRTGVIGAERNRSLRRELDALHTEMYHVAKSKSRDIQERYSNRNAETKSNAISLSNRDSRYSNRNYRSRQQNTDVRDSTTMSSHRYTTSRYNRGYNDEVIEKQLGVTVRPHDASYRSMRDSSFTRYHKGNYIESSFNHDSEYRGSISHRQSNLNRDSVSPDVGDDYLQERVFVDARIDTSYRY